MASRITSLYKSFRKKRDLILSLVFSSLMLFIGLVITNFFLIPNNELIEILLVLFLLIFIVVLIFVREGLFSINMYLHFYRMIEENQPPFQANAGPFEPSFTNNLNKYEFTLGIQQPDYQIYYRLYRRLPWVERTQPSIVFVILSQTQGLDIDSMSLEADLTSIKDKLNQQSPIQNELTLLIKKYDVFSDEVKEQTQKIINFAYQNRAIVSIPCASFRDGRVYALRPKKLFPSKYYYVLIRLLYYLTEADEML
jgi:hypothetical protein